MKITIHTPGHFCKTVGYGRPAPSQYHAGDRGDPIISEVDYEPSDALMGTLSFGEYTWLIASSVCNRLHEVLSGDVPEVQDCHTFATYIGAGCITPYGQKPLGYQEILWRENGGRDVLAEHAREGDIVQIRGAHVGGVHSAYMLGNTHYLEKKGRGGSIVLSSVSDLPPSFARPTLSEKLIMSLLRKG